MDAKVRIGRRLVALGAARTGGGHRGTFGFSFCRARSGPLHSRPSRQLSYSHTLAVPGKGLGLHLKWTLQLHYTGDLAGDSPNYALCRYLW